MHSDGFKEQQIADALGIALSTLKIHVKGSLIDEGKIPDKRLGTSWTDLSNEAVKKLIDMHNRGMTLQYIGNFFGFTREYARIIIKDIRAVHGDEVLRKEELYTVPQAAKCLQCTKGRLRQVLEEIKCPKKGVMAYLITHETLNQLRNFLTSRQKKVCPLCSKEFQCRCMSETYCKECKKRENFSFLRREHHNRNPRFFQEGWIKAVNEALQKQQIPPNEQWLRPCMAEKRAGITSMQLNFLKTRGVVVTQNHPTRKNKIGNPVSLYSASQMDIIRRVRCAHAN